MIVRAVLKKETLSPSQAVVRTLRWRDCQRRLACTANAAVTRTAVAFSGSASDGTNILTTVHWSPIPNGVRAGDDWLDSSGQHRLEVRRVEVVIAMRSPR